MQIDLKYPSEIQPGETDRFTHKKSGHNNVIYAIHEHTRAFQKTWFTGWGRAFRWWQTCLSPMPIEFPFQGLARDIMEANQEFCELMAKDYKKPDFNIDSVIIGNDVVEVKARSVAETPFCSLLHFQRKTDRNDPKVLIVAPLSGHYATLLRPTVKRMLKEHDVYITDWNNARDVPIEAGDFGIDHYISHIVAFLETIGPNVSVMAVCQPVVPVLAAVSMVAQSESPVQPLSMVLMGGPIDTEVATSEVTELAEGNEIEFFEQNLIGIVPEGYAGAGRKVFPGFMALTSFVAMNPGRHASSYMGIWNNRIQGRHEKADKTIRFYDEYNAVLDNYGRFYLETVQEVFKDEDLAKGRMRHFGHLVDPGKITHTSLLTVEGAKDDISPPGQTTAAHRLCVGLDGSRKYHYLETEAGHYGIFSGRKWRQKVAPRVTGFIRDAAIRAGLEFSPALETVAVEHFT